MGRAFKVGARGSALSIVQTKAAIRFLREKFPKTSWRFVAMDTPGDRDRTTPLEKSAPDFFTRDLDDAVREGRIDCAVHSAKDMPGYWSEGGPMAAEGLDWFWLPEREDPRDCWVFPASSAVASSNGFNGLKGLKNVKWPDRPRIGISSARRMAYAKKVFPKATLPPVRGTIDSRIRQMLEGRYDALLMAVAGLKRLFKLEGDKFKLDGKTVQIVPIDIADLSPPEAQGVLAVTFRAGDRRFLDMRERFVKAVRFVSAGVGDAGLCTLAGLRDIAAADVVLYDDLLGRIDEIESYSRNLSNGRDPVFMPVGKRCGAHSMKQPEITRLICDEARKGRRVVRLKGGDAGLFGRLTEETSALEELRIPFMVRPGVSALTAATTGTGMLLTRRGTSCGFTAMTPRSTGPEMPLVLFMAVRVAAVEAARLIAAGRHPKTPCAIVFDAAGPCEEIWQGTLSQLAKDNGLKGFKGSNGLSGLKGLNGLNSFNGLKCGKPGLVIIGEAAAHVWPKLGVLAGRRMLVTASDAVQPRVCMAVEDLGGRHVSWPMIELKARRIPDLEKGAYGAIVLTSPSAARIFFENCKIDRRRLPKFFTCGAGTDAELRRWGVSSDLMPESDFSAKGLISAINGLNGSNGLKGLKGVRVLRLRSAKAGSAVADALKTVGAKVDDVVLYDNIAKAPRGPLPPFDDVHFASASAVEAFLAAYGVAALRGKGVYVMGEPTRAALPPRLRRRACLFAIFSTISKGKKQ